MSEWRIAICFAIGCFAKQNLGSAVTFWWLRWRTDDAKLLAKLEENYKKNMNNPEKMKGLAARLEALQKQQEMQKQKYRRK